MYEKTNFFWEIKNNKLTRENTEENFDIRLGNMVT